ncbi:hypothetical protein SLS60_000441 [Paraconiothyrium brasiliense]|uniref:Heterokaryon incompatibility domain-containing protein n=1 Tax=Paraconiothyrium brasiliense TaxID=300254 RepID=A0ABR3S6F9_9PLEO
MAMQYEWRPDINKATIQYILEAERDRFERQAYSQEALEQVIHDFRYVEADRLARNQILIERPIINKTKALTQAFRSYNLSLVKMLIAHGARLEDQEIFAEHRTPLETAAKYGQVDIVEYLLSKDVTTRPVSAKNKQAALRYAHMEVADLIQAGAALNAPSIRFSLRSAASQGHMDALERLLDIGVSMESADGALQEAAGNGHIDAVHRLLQAGDHVNAQYEGPTALQRAAAGKDSSIVQLLLEAGANTSVLSHEGSTVKEGADIDGKAEFTQPLNAKPILRFSESREGVLSPTEGAGKGICLDCHSLFTELYTNEFTSRVFDPDSYHGFDQMSLDVLDLDTLPQPTEFIHLSTQFLQEYAQNGCQMWHFFCQQITGSKMPLSQSAKLSIVVGRDGVPAWVLRKPSDFKRPYRHLVGSYFHIAMDSLCDVQNPSELECLRRALPGNTGPSRTFHYISLWLQDCFGQHRGCEKIYDNGFLPARLVDLSEWRHQQKLRLVDSKTLEGHPRYMTLSHRWDKQVLEVSTLTTNIQSRLQDLDAHELPITLKEAIQTAHSLNVDYVWIDCLCIVQDSPGDWVAEAALMSKVYRNSYCTIAANRSLPGSLFSVYNVDDDYAEFELPLEKVRVSKKLTRWDSSIHTGQLAKRGWCFQERELSPRILHWTDEQVLWECRNSSLSEAGVLRTQGYYNRNTETYQRMQRILDGIEHKNVEEIYALWYTTVAEYTGRDLTKREDTLPAIGSLARVPNERLKTQYLAGLWYEDISRSLAWRCYRGIRHDTYIAPSWSWALVGRHGGYGNYYQSYHFRDEKSTACTTRKGLSSINGHNIRLATADPYGNVISGQILVSGPAIWATLERKAYNDTEIVLRGLDQVTPHHVNEVIEHHKGYEYEISGHIPSWNYRGVLEIDVESDAYLYCSVICIALCYYNDEKPQRREAVGLGLVPVEGESNTYRRIGRVSDTSMDDLVIAPIHNLIII